MISSPASPPRGRSNVVLVIEIAVPIHFAAHMASSVPSDAQPSDEVWKSNPGILCRLENQFQASYVA